MINLGEAARDLRTSLKLSIRDAADELEMSFVHLCNIENGKASPSAEIIRRFRVAWGIDLYMYAVCKFSDAEDVPPQIRQSVRAMAAGWKRQIKDVIQRRAKGVKVECLDSKR